MRDSAERVKTYCEEFSPKLRGYTGDKEQVRHLPSMSLPIRVL